MKGLFQILFVCCLVAIFAGDFFAQNKTPCQVTKNLGGKYKFVDSFSSEVEGRNVFFLKISLSPNKFNQEYLLKVAQRIRETHCKENNIIAEIWDKSLIRKYDDLTPPPIYAPWTKAVYALDRRENKESIQFISNEKVTGEIKIQ